MLAGALASASCTGQDDEVSPYWGAMGIHQTAGIYVTVYSHEDARDLGADQWREAFLLETRQEDDGSVRFFGEFSSNYLTDIRYLVSSRIRNENDATEVLYNANRSHTVSRFCVSEATTGREAMDQDAGSVVAQATLHATDHPLRFEADFVYGDLRGTIRHRTYWMSADPSVALVPFIDTWDTKGGRPVERLLRVDAPLGRASGATCAALQVVRAWMRAATPESLAPVRPDRRESPTTSAAGPLPRRVANARQAQAPFLQVPANSKADDSRSPRWRDALTLPGAAPGPP